MSNRITNNHKGQAALMMVLLMTVISAVVISFAGRATTETRIQNMMTDSTAAFLVAQSGIEDALQRGTAVSNTLDAGTYAVTVDEEGEEYILSESMVPGSTLEVTTAGGVGLVGAKIYWQSLGATQSSLFVTVSSDSGIKDYAFDEEGENGFTKGSPSTSFQGVDFSYVTAELPLAVDTKNIKISVYGSPTKIGVEPIGDIFPSQVLKYRSNASVGSGTTKTVYGLEYEESKNNKLPEIFDYAVFSNGAIVQ